MADIQRIDLAGIDAGIGRQLEEGLHLVGMARLDAHGTDLDLAGPCLDADLEQPGHLVIAQRIAFAGGRAPDIEPDAGIGDAGEVNLRRLFIHPALLIEGRDGAAECAECIGHYQVPQALRP